LCASLGLHLDGIFFNSKEWFEANNCECVPSLVWWQEVAKLTLEIKLSEPKDLTVCVKEPRTLLFGCRQGSTEYKLHLVLKEEVVGKDVETRMDSGKIIITVSKKEEKVWPVQLLESERRQYNSLDWISYDLIRSAGLSDSEDEDEDD
jgi:hypothetical protein